MLNITSVSPSELQSREQSIRINRHLRAVSVQAALFRFQDKDTKQFIMYMPALEISSYGETREKATEMFKAELDDFFKYLTDMTKRDMESTLIKLGFKQKLFNNKVYSKSFVDSDGNLHSINAVEGQVELLSVEA
jgi:hypothetical protein